MKAFEPLCRVQLNLTKALPIITLLFISMILFSTQVVAQKKQQMVRLAKITVDPVQLQEYNAALKEQMTTAVKVEPGVLTYYAVADKNNLSNITILEIYADTAAYERHITTPHFKKYKETVKNMVTSLELIDMTLLGSAKKPGM